MCFQPVCAPAAVGNEWYLHLKCLLHLFHNYALHLFAFFWQYGEVELVVYLHYDFCVDKIVRFAKPKVDTCVHFHVTLLAFHRAL